MKTKEFIKKIKSIGYGVGTVSGSEEELCVVGNNLNVILSVHTEDTFGINTDWYEFKRLDDEDKEELLDIAFDYIKTPVEEREETKKYYLRLPENFIGKKLSERSYLNFCKSDNEYLFHDNRENQNFQTQFTQEEINKLDTTHLIKEEV